MSLEPKERAQRQPDVVPLKGTKSCGAGTAHRLAAELSGSGTLDAAQLRAQVAEVRASGAGAARVWAQGTMKARASGSGAIAYRGSPYFELRKSSGSGTIRPLAEAEYASAPNARYRAAGHAHGESP